MKCRDWKVLEVLKPTLLCHLWLLITLGAYRGSKMPFIWKHCGCDVSSYFGSFIHSFDIFICYAVITLLMKKCLETNILFRNFPFRERIKLDLQSHIIVFHKEKATVIKISMEMSTNILELMFLDFFTYL